MSRSTVLDVEVSMRAVAEVAKVPAGYADVSVDELLYVHTRHFPAITASEGSIHFMRSRDKTHTEAFKF